MYNRWEASPSNKIESKRIDIWTSDREYKMDKKSGEER